MDNVLVGFETFLIEHTKLSEQSYRSYKKDLAEFIEYLEYKNCKLIEITASLLNDYFSLLHTRQLGTATAVRKFCVLKLLCTYLHSKCNLPDLSFVVPTDKNVPFLCSPETVQTILHTYKNKSFEEYQELPYRELRNFTLLYLLSYTSLTINKLVLLKKNNLCPKTYTLQYACPKTGSKTIDLSPAFFSALEVYLQKIPFVSEYLFALQSGGKIKPFSRQAAWVLVKNMLEEGTKKRPLPESFTQLLDDDIKELYKKHPRS
ncbi:site-specific integrase [Candidatus Dependentiae bacterium]|nr:site-specific integrase [Candidatus Dependentiae bacterium]